MLKLKRKGKACLALSGTGIYLVNERNKFFGVHETIAELWKMCDGRVGLQEIVDEFMRSCGNPKSVPVDIYGIVNRLKEAGLLEVLPV